ncbi:MAG: HNH endonuclease [Chloroflexi bacterium]|nr:HNH endonuclease [Chloroflexota bacterium]
MPTRSARPCNWPGCPALITDGRYCPEHKTAYNRRRDQTRGRGTTTERGLGSDWQKFRQVVLNTNPLCADPFGIHAEAGQVVLAVEVDHIKPRAEGGGNTWDNVQPLCRECHRRKSAQESKANQGARRQALQKSLIPVTIVTGPPGSGKTSYVRDHCAWGDLIVDVDALFQALSGQAWYDKPIELMPYVLAARDAVLERLGKETTKVRHGWVVTSEADVAKLERMQHSLGADLIVLEVDATECVLRISRDERRSDKTELWRKLVNAWWDKYNLSKLHASMTNPMAPDQHRSYQGNHEN